jgi:hypothetical protein
MIENPCVKCKWFRRSDLGGDQCGKVKVSGSPVYGKVYNYVYIHHIDVEETRILECMGKGFEPNTLEKLIRFFRGVASKLMKNKDKNKEKKNDFGGIGA